MADFLGAVFLGLVVGSIYSLMAFGLVVTYRTSGVFNFAHGAVGMFFAYVFFQLTQGGQVDFVVTTYSQHWHLPVVVALVLVVGVLAPAFGFVMDRVLFRKLRHAASVVKIVATIGVLISLIGLAGVVWGQGTTLVPRSIFGQHVFAAGGFRATLAEFASVALAIGLAVALMLFLRFSPLGIRMRAVVDRAEVAELMGIDSGRVSALSWALGTSFGALAGILLVPFFSTLDTTTLSFLVVTAAAAAVVGRLESLPLTLAGGFGIGVAQFVVQRYTSTNLSRQLLPSIPFIVLFLILLLPIPFREVSEAPSRAPRPAGAGQSQAGRASRVFLVVVALVILPFVVSSSWQFQLASVPPMALLFLSLVLLSGHAGQISLSQAAFAGFGAFVAAHLMVDHHVPLLVAALIGGAAALPLGAILAGPASRLSPLFLGFATLAFAAMMDQVAFQSVRFTRGLQGIQVNRPSYLLGPRMYYLAGLAIFGVFAVLVHNLRKGRTGLALAAMHDSQVGVASLGTSVVRLKFAAFCVSAFIAGVAGALFAAAVGQASPLDFFAQQSLLVLALAAIGGIGRWSGALVGAILFRLAAPFVEQGFVGNNVVSRHLFHGQLGDLLPVFFGLGAIGLAQNPFGIVEQVRDGVGRLRERLSGTAPLRVKRAVVESAVAQADGHVVSFPGATLYHRLGCVLGAGKQDTATELDSDSSLRPCPICQPPALAVGEGSS